MNLLELGFQRDELIFLLVPDCVESYVVRLACEKAGILCLTALTVIREHEIEHALKKCAVKGIVIQAEFRGFDFNRAVNGMKSKVPDLKHVFCIGDHVPPNSISIEAMCHKSPKGFHNLEQTRFKMDDVGIVALTSGTTGMPKVAEHPVGARVALGDAYHEKLDLRRDDIVLNVINAVAGLGAAFCYSSVRDGAKRVVMEIWDAKKALQIIDRERPTVLLTTPAQLAMLLKESDFDNYDTSSIRVVFCGTSPLSIEMARSGEAKLGIPILNGYGSFDGGGISSTAVSDKEETRLATAGQPFPGNEVRIVDKSGNQVARGEEGELIFRGPCSCSGYYMDLERTLKAWKTLGKHGWFHSGDLAKLDGENNIILTGRIKEVIIRGGQNIYPPEIEGFLLMHPSVRHVALVPMPDPIMGEKVCAFVETKNEVVLSFDDMTAFLLEKKIAKYKIPERLEIRKSLPLRSEQKVAKGVLIEEIKNILKTEGKNINRKH